jgi:hypothetical protein
MNDLQIYEHLTRLIREKYPDIYIQELFKTEKDIHKTNGRFISEFQGWSILTVCCDNYADEEIYSSLTATLVHEFGHYICWRTTSEKEYKIMQKSYKKYLNLEPLSKKDIKKILKEENDAWWYGFQFLKDANIPITDEIRDQYDQSYSSHKYSTNVLYFNWLNLIFYKIGNLLFGNVNKNNYE